MRSFSLFHKIDGAYGSCLVYRVHTIHSHSPSTQWIQNTTTCKSRVRPLGNPFEVGQVVRALPVSLKFNFLIFKYHEPVVDSITVRAHLAIA